MELVALLAQAGPCAGSGIGLAQASSPGPSGVESTKQVSHGSAVSPPIPDPHHRLLRVPPTRPAVVRADSVSVNGFDHHLDYTIGDAQQIDHSKAAQDQTKTA